MSKTIDFVASQYKVLPAHTITGVSIGEHFNPHNRFNVYVVYVNFMLGDADGTVIEELTFTPEQMDDMIEFLNFCERCARRYPHGKGGYDTYQDVVGYFKWVESDHVRHEDDYDEDDLAAMNAELDLYWSGEGDELRRGLPSLDWAMQEYEYDASFEKAHVVYYDTTGLQRDVKLEVV